MEDSVFVTGATGFIGQAVVRALLEQGHSVRALVRTNSRWPFPAHSRLTKTIGDVCDRESLSQALKGCMAVVHLAAAKNDERESEEINVGGAKNLIETCRREGIGCIINVSTQSAKLRRKGIYGRTKDEADRLLHTSGIPVTTLRCSLVYADLVSGVFGSIVRFTRLPIIPVIGSGTPRFHPIHRDDLAMIIKRALTLDGTRGKIYDIGGIDAVTFNELVAKILQFQNRQRLVVHLPLWLASILAHIFAILPHPPITVSNVLGAAEDMPMDIAPMLQDFGVTPRSLTDGLSQLFEIERKSVVAREAVTLLTYVASASGIQSEPSEVQIERYMHALERHRISRNPTLDVFVPDHPLLLGIVDAASHMIAPDGILRRKLLIAAAIIECDPSSAEVLLPQNLSRASLVWKCTYLCMRIALKWLLALPLFLFPAFLRRNCGAR